jgi:hypothetical protein
VSSTSREGQRLLLIWKKSGTGVPAFEEVQDQVREVARQKALAAALAPRARRSRKPPSRVSRASRSRTPCRRGRPGAGRANPSRACPGFTSTNGIVPDALCRPW